MASKSKRCAFNGCIKKTTKAVKIKPHEEIIGYCKKCEKYYCIDCRLPETHGCIHKIVLSEEEKKKQIEALKCSASKTTKI